MCPLQARTQLKKSFPNASKSSLLVNWFKLCALSRFSYHAHSKPKPVITPPAPHTTTRHNTKQIPRGMWHIAHAQKAVPRVRGCANSTPTADEWMDGRVGRPGACGCGLYVDWPVPIIGYCLTRIPPDISFDANCPIKGSSLDTTLFIKSIEAKLQPAWIKLSVQIFAYSINPFLIYIIKVDISYKISILLI